MAKPDWNVSKDEEGLSQVLNQIEECKAAGDNIEYGNGLLELSQLVKWVRSDTEAPPFFRSHELALQALAIFREAQHKAGQVKALVACCAIADRHAAATMLMEAETLARSLQDDDLLGTVLSRKATSLIPFDAEGAKHSYRQAIELFQKTKNHLGQARCLFGLAICHGDSTQKRDRAYNAAQLFRESGEWAEAARSISLAYMNAQEVQQLVELEDLAREGLDYSQRAMNSTLEKSFYDKLALIAVAKGDIEESEKFRRWGIEIEKSDGLTERERWENEIEMVKHFIAVAKMNGNKDAQTMFQQELKRLKASKPRA